MRRKRTKNLILTSLFLLAIAPAARGEDISAQLKKLEKFDFSHQLVPVATLEALQKEYDGGDEVPPGELVRGIVFGRHGRIFHETKIQTYLQSRPWYRPNPKFTNDMLDETERKNVDIIREFESKHHWGARPGDLRFWRTKKIPALDQDMQYSLSDIRIMRAEIEAIHGRAFPNEPLLQKYFNERYWYKPDPSYRPAQLSSVERANMAALDAFEKKLRKSTFSPRDVILYSDKLIPTSAISKLSLNELRLTRNAVYALRGRRFESPWMREFLDDVDWYSPLPEGQKETLLPIDSENLKRIVAQERKLHEELTRKPIPHQRLVGLYVEDLRKLANEIPARHGKVFADRAMRNYFSAQPWYKPNAAYSDRLLTKVEKQNYKFLLQAAKDTTTQFEMEEG